MTVPRVYSQIVIAFLAIGLCAILVEFKIPGHRTFTDQDQGVLVSIGFSFLLVAGGFLLNSIYFYRKRHWTNYRKVAMTLSLVLFSAVIFPREALLYIWFGAESKVYRSTSDFSYCKITLYENGGFISSTYNGNLAIENIGIYELSDTLKLYATGEKAPGLCTEFIVMKDAISCMETSNKLESVSE